MHGNGFAFPVCSRVETPAGPVKVEPQVPGTVLSAHLGEPCQPGQHQGGGEGGETGTAQCSCSDCCLLPPCSALPWEPAGSWGCAACSHLWGPSVAFLEWWPGPAAVQRALAPHLFRGWGLGPRLSRDVLNFSLLKRAFDALSRRCPLHLSSCLWHSCAPLAATGMLCLIIPRLSRLCVSFDFQE